MINTLGVCSWSLRAEGVGDLLQRIEMCGVTHLQLALKPLDEQPGELSAMRTALDSGVISLCSGMLSTIGEDYSTLESIRHTGGLRPDEHWAENLRLAERCAAIAGELGLELVTLHAGFIPEDNETLHRQMVDRLCRVAELFNKQGVALGLETGQERAETLMGLLSTIAPRVRVGVNFDPANMILYGMGDPIDAMRTLSDHIVQVHMKDAIETSTPGTWGTEVPAGQGQVDWDAFFEIIEELERPVGVVIERETGEQRVEDISTAYALACRQIRRVRE